jgi:hypothetical protein
MFQNLENCYQAGQKEVQRYAWEKPKQSYWSLLSRVILNAVLDKPGYMFLLILRSMVLTDSEEEEEKGAVTYSDFFSIRGSNRGAKASSSGSGTSHFSKHH